MASQNQESNITVAPAAKEGDAAQSPSPSANVLDEANLERIWSEFAASRKAVKVTSLLALKDVKPLEPSDLK